MIWLIRSSPGLRRSSCRWSDSQLLKTLDAALDRLVLRPGQPDVEAGCAEFAELEDARPRFVGHPEDVADDRDGKLEQ